MNKKISTPIAFLTIIVCAILVGGLTVWQYLEIPKETSGQPTEGLVSEKVAEELKIDNYLHLHPDAILTEGITPMMRESGYRGIFIREAVVYAIQYLEARGVKDIEICETTWIAAPVGGYLIDGKGNFNIGDKHYSTFRIGIRDGAEGNVGTEFVFIVRGEDKKGNVIWYPEPEPDMPDYYLWEREKFESLSSRFK